MLWWRTAYAPPGATASTTSWVGTCVNPDDNKTYLIAYRDCCGKPACGLCHCDNQDREHTTLCPTDKQRHYLVFWPRQHAVSLLHCSSGWCRAVRRTIIAAMGMAATTQAATADEALVFESNCALCHQAGAVGVPGQFPHWRVGWAQLPQRQMARNFSHLWCSMGMSGRVTVDGETILGIMPSFEHTIG